MTLPRSLPVAALVGLLLLPSPTRARGTERELFDRAGKVALVKIIRLGRHERPPDWRPDFRFRHQVLWTEDVELFKGEPTGDLGYDLVMLPYQEPSRFAPWFYFRQSLTPSDLPQDATVLLYLERDPDGYWRILDGPEGFFRYPGTTRLKNLAAWSDAGR